MSSSSSVRLWFLVSLVVVIITLQVPPGVKGDDNRDAQIITLAASCTSKCRDLCAALPKSEDLWCDQRCNSIPTAFNGSVKDPAALDPNTAFTAVQEMQMCLAGCVLRCKSPIKASNARSCMDKCTETFRHFGPIITLLGKAMAANGLAAPAMPPPHAPGKDDFKLEACTDSCNRKCATTAAASQGKTQAASCGGSCAEACGLYRGATTVLQATMPPAAVPSPAALGDDTVANTFKACSDHCAVNDNKCATKCRYACYIVSNAKASMKLATGSFGLPA